MYGQGVVYYVADIRSKCYRGDVIVVTMEITLMKLCCCGQKLNAQTHTHAHMQLPIQPNENIILFN